MPEELCSYLLEQVYQIVDLHEVVLVQDSPQQMSSANQPSECGAKVAKHLQLSAVSHDQ